MTAPIIDEYYRPCVHLSCRHGTLIARNFLQLLINRYQLQCIAEFFPWKLPLKLLKNATHLHSMVTSLKHFSPSNVRTIFYQPSAKFVNSKRYVSTQCLFAKGSGIESESVMPFKNWTQLIDWTVTPCCVEKFDRPCSNKIICLKNLHPLQDIRTVWW